MPPRQVRLLLVRCGGREVFQGKEKPADLSVALRPEAWRVCCEKTNTAGQGTPGVSLEAVS